MPDTSLPIIDEPSLKDLLRLPHLYHKAVERDFSFYNEPVKKRIVAKNSFFRLVLARLKPNRLLYVARVNNEPVGVIIGSFTGSGIGVVHWIFVLPEHRARKIGKLLMERAELFFKKHGCHKISLTTEIAPDFYKHLGYETEGVLKKHWWNKDFYIMSKSF